MARRPAAGSGRNAHPAPLRRRLTRRWRVLPRLICAGAQRSGTTSLMKWLRQHPAFVPGLRKEIHFFDLHYRPSVGAYRAFFPLARELETRGEGAFTADVTPGYLLQPAAPGRLAAMVPEARLVVLLRDPTRRLISQYHKSCRAGRESRSLSEVVEEQLAIDPALRASGDVGAKPENSLARGRYLDQLRRWREHFPATQMLLVCSERFFAESQAWLDRIADFAGVARWQPDLSVRSGVHPYPDADADLVRALDEYFAPHNEALFEDIGERFPWGEARQRLAGSGTSGSPSP